jgi:hypothetical protein
MSINDYVKAIQKAIATKNYDLAKQILADMEKDFPTKQN